MRKKTLLCTLGAIVMMLAGSYSLAQMPPSWVWPMYNAGQPVEKQITVVERYTYQEKRYEPPVMIRPVQKKDARDRTPEEAMISRVSAMMASDYHWWLDTWEPTSRKLFLEREQAAGRTEDYWLQWWSDTFQFARYVLVRRIETDPYVVVVYRMMSPEGKEVGQEMEFPSVFRRVQGRWLVTADLVRDPLVSASPWVSGKHSQEIVVR